MIGNPAELAPDEAPTGRIGHQNVLELMHPAFPRKTLLSDKLIFAFCGIADPHSFIHSAEELSLQIKDSRFFRDHQDYTDSVIFELSEQIRSNGISYVITTEKDLVKLPNSFLSEFEIYVIKINIKFDAIPNALLYQAALSCGYFSYSIDLSTWVVTSSGLLAENLPTITSA